MFSLASKSATAKAGPLLALALQHCTYRVEESVLIADCVTKHRPVGGIASWDGILGKGREGGREQQSMVRM